MMVLCARRLVHFAFLLSLLGFVGVSYGQEAPASLEKLIIVTQAGESHILSVEVMRSELERAKGLMHRRYLPPNRGMLFDFKITAPVQMWMQNTYIPLDMLFIRANGTIARIAANTEPLSTRVIPSGEPVLAVLEINAGLAEKLKISVGDRVQHGLFTR
jgi:uncharacterized protein